MWLTEKLRVDSNVCNILLIFVAKLLNFKQFTADSTDYQCACVRACMRACVCERHFDVYVSWPCYQTQMDVYRFFLF